MATLDDKLLGEKLEYYCSSSEDEEEQDVVTHQNEADIALSNREYSGNTGPKGVIKDWQKFKRLERELQLENEKDKLALMKKLSLNCQTHLDEERERSQNDKIDEEFAELLKESDSILKEFMQRRMEEMIVKKQQLPRFGILHELISGSDFLDALDKENPNVLVVCHIYSGNISGCEAMNGCLRCLASQYPDVKFCTISANVAKMSKHFEESGCPALLVYKGGVLLGNFVRLTDEFGEEFYAVDVEAFLVEHGFLPDQSLIPELMKSRNIRDGNDDDSDFELE